MRKDAIAERFLLLFFSRERASAVVGDLREAGRFSRLSLLRVAGAAVLRDLTAAPLRLAVISVAGLAAMMAILFLSVVAAAAVFGILWGVAAGVGLSYRPGSLIMNSFEAVFVLPALFQAGKWLGRWSRGREVAALVSLLVVNASCSLVGNGLKGLALAAALIPVAAGLMRERVKRYA